MMQVDIKLANPSGALPCFVFRKCQLLQIILIGLLSSHRDRFLGYTLIKIRKNKILTKTSHCYTLIFIRVQTLITVALDKQRKLNLSSKSLNLLYELVSSRCFSLLLKQGVIKLTLETTTMETLNLVIGVQQQKMLKVDS